MRNRAALPTIVLVCAACWATVAATDDAVELVLPKPPAVQSVDNDNPSGAPRIEFLSGEQALAVIDSAWTDWYFDQWSDAGVAAKTSVELPEGEARDERLRRAYRASILEFSAEEQAALRWGIDKLHAVMQEHYPLLARTTWRLIKTDGTLDGGLPHTLDSAIVIQPGWLARFIEEHKSDQAYATTNLLAHELLHVVQRSHRGAFNPAYRDIFGFTQATSIVGPASLAERRLLNPDVDGNEWVYELKSPQGSRWFWVTVLLKKDAPTKPSLRDIYDARIEVEPTDDGFRVVVDENGVAVELQPDELTKFRERFAYTNLIDHPGEIAAYGVGLLLSLEAAGQDPPAEGDLARLRAWLMEQRLAAADRPGS